MHPTDTNTMYVYLLIKDGYLDILKLWCQFNMISSPLC